VVIGLSERLTQWLIDLFDKDIIGDVQVTLGISLWVGSTSGQNILTSKALKKSEDTRKHHQHAVELDKRKLCIYL